MEGDIVVNKKSDGFDIPIVLLIFKRSDTLTQILKVIAQIKPQKLYIIADAGRSEEESYMVNKARNRIEELIDWPCEVIKNYAKENRGVFENIGQGARWVFEQEEKAIFLEDDNLPEVTFFEYCRQLLEKYEKNEKILWVCGTNYLGKYKMKDGSSYAFTQNLLPCGWASWSNKFLKYYDGQLEHMKEKNISNILRKRYFSKALFKQQFNSIRFEYHKLCNNEKFRSWDYQMLFSLKYYNLYGISPCNNQIKNIGVDNLSEHGGNSFSNIMTRRFCGMNSYPLNFPLIHPKLIAIDDKYEKKIEKIILYPFWRRVRNNIVASIKRILNIPEYIPFSDYVYSRRKNK